MNKVVPDWQFLSHIGRVKLFAPSLLLIMLVPILSRLSNVEFDYKFLIGMLDIELPQIPVNMLRAFWGSVAMVLGQIGYLMLCPDEIQLYRSFDDWLNNSTDASKLDKTLRKKHGKHGADTVSHELRKVYHEKISNTKDRRVWPRFFILLLYVIGIYLYIRILISQMDDVFNVTKIIDILFF